MKLYTEEQVKQMLFDLGDVLFNNNQNGIKEGEPAKHFDEILKCHTPIELPSDEEIREERLLQFPDTEYTNRANDRLAFYCGAKFVMKKIKGGNK